MAARVPQAASSLTTPGTEAGGVQLRLEGEPVTIRIPAGTPNGRVFRVKGRGIRTATGTGDLLVAVDLVVPASLTDEERAAIEALRAASTQAPRAHLGV